MLQWNIYRNSYILIQENAFENVVWSMTANLFQIRGVKLCKVLPGLLRNVQQWPGTYFINSDWANIQKYGMDK